MRENLLVVSKILAFGIWIIARGIQNPTNDWNQKPVPGIRNPLYGIQIPRLLGSLTWGELVTTSCVEDSGFFQRKGKNLEDACAPQERKGPSLFLSYVSLLTRSFKTYPINLRLPCTLWLLRQHSIQTRQISSSASWNSFLLFIKNIYSLIISFISERQKMMDARSCKGKLSTLQEGGGGGEVGGGGRWGMNGIRQNRPFIKMASRLKFSFSVAEQLFIISQNILSNFQWIAPEFHFSFV